ncbi:MULTISPECIES: ABC transporter substrate-binding protein [Bradyrhizobium]|jgi:branched-chain amino acid transport system substrate-binding protein|uniref:ABC transporter substrate-binding protein n=1 Tax=Bradyrhizobium TaxID=374 RepID=UPI000231BE77|nr:ABC transporter substrate-binding protein [Bradyrhizobium japonicum]MBR0763287.1 ABC transporter substrate-binding protein [Bradyrhizobium japonicum]MCS3534844.1 branched-chain amino acid transport system substrate-binding protein [Bradyrhizobium japonicum]MCS3989059.1 branched-chain amino acid transport system substrate-binding protein [Bradyrhizobium japonicum]MCS4016125.1 branched-chain amino acid transport system substrate-binding protein [Bradyrhizobium japonicum]MCS4203220.1 branched-
MKRFALAALVFAASTFSADAQETWRIGALYPLTGGLALLGNENLNGARIAVDMINEKGGIAGKKVELVQGDASTPDKAQSEAERLSSLENLQIITGTYSSGLSYAASQVVERRGGIYWETGGIADGLTKRGFSGYFRLVFTASSNGQLAASLAASAIAPRLGKKPADLNVLIVHEDSDYGTSVATAAETKAKELGFKVAGRLPYKAATTDLAPLVLRMKASSADIVIASSYANDALLIQRQMKQLGINVGAFIGTGGIYGLASFGEGLGSAVNGIFDTEGSAGINPASLSEEARTLLAEFQKRFQTSQGKAPSYVGTQGFVGTYILLDKVLRTAGVTDPARLKEAALALDIPTGGTSLGWGVKFVRPGSEMQGQNERSFPVAQQWQDGKLVVVAPDNLKTGDPVLVPLQTWDKR